MRVSDSIYLDYQATTPVDDRVFEAMQPFFTESFGNPHSSNHILGWRSLQSVEDARRKVADLIGSLEEEVIFTSGATEANNHVMFGVMSAWKKARKIVLISSIEHKCVKEAAYHFASIFDCHVKEIPVLSSGLVDVTAYEEMLSDDVLLVSIMAVNNEIGVIQDIPMLASMARAAGALFHCDAAQAPEAIDLDVVEMDVDFLSLSSHKIYGPKGIGCLYVETSLQDGFPAFIYGGGQQGGMRAGTLPTPLCVGFGAAASIIGNEKVARRITLKALSDLFIRKLDSFGVLFSLNGDATQRHPGNLNVRFHGVDAESLLNALQPLLCASTGSACNSGFIESSYVLAAIGLSPEEAASSIRFSLGRFSTPEQVTEAAELIAKKIVQLSS